MMSKPVGSSVHHDHKTDGVLDAPMSRLKFCNVLEDVPSSEYSFLQNNLFDLTHNPHIILLRIQELFCIF